MQVVGFEPTISRLRVGPSLLGASLVEVSGADVALGASENEEHSSEGATSSYVRGPRDARSPAEMRVGLFRLNASERFGWDALLTLCLERRTTH